MRINLLATTLLLLVVGCQTAQKTFNTPEQAADALVTAVRDFDREEIKRIFGPELNKLGSGDERQDDEDFQRFAAAYDRRHDLQRAEDGTYTLLVGEEYFEFPAPIVEEKGKWKFDTATGIDEMRNRRIGRNEFAAIRACQGYVKAQREYYVLDPDNDTVPAYANRIISSAGKRDGLYWPAGENEDQSPIGPALAEAIEEGHIKTAADNMPAYNGYHFRVLSKQGPGANGGAMSYLDDAGRMVKGYALLAWPADYGHSGVMSFQVSADGKVYEKNLGEQTAAAAAKIDAFDPSGWADAKIEK